MQGLSFKSAINTGLETSQESYLKFDFSNFIVHIDKMLISIPALRGLLEG